MSKNGVSRHVFGPFLRISNICQQIRNFRDKHLISVAFERTECLLLHGTELYHSNFGICSTGCPKVMISDTFVHRHVPVHFKVKFCLFFKSFGRVLWKKPSSLPLEITTWQDDLGYSSYSSFDLKSNFLQDRVVLKSINTFLLFFRQLWTFIREYRWTGNHQKFAWIL